MILTERLGVPHGLPRLPTLPLEPARAAEILARAKALGLGKVNGFNALPKL